MARTTNEYLTALGDRFTRYFDLEREKVLQGRTIPLFAVSRRSNERYFLSKSIKVYGYHNYEYVAVMPVDGLLTVSAVDDFAGYLVSLVPALVTPSTEHMSTYLTGVLVGSSISPEAVVSVQRFAFARNFAWGLKGWCDIRLILVDLDNVNVYANKKGKEVMSHYRP